VSGEVAVRTHPLVATHIAARLDEGEVADLIASLAPSS
jgi:hypothetical protein